LKAANAAPAHKKTHVILSIKSLEASPAGEHPEVMSENDFRAFLRNALQARKFSQFNYHAPLLAAYFHTFLFDDKTDVDATAHPGGTGHGFGFSRLCQGCKYGAWALSWTEGASDFFIDYAKSHKTKQDEYKAWKYPVDLTHAQVHGHAHPDLEDNFYGFCSDFADTPTGGTVEALKAECIKGWNGATQKVCKLVKGDGNAVGADTDVCSPYTATTTLGAGHCKCVTS